MQETMQAVILHHTPLATLVHLRGEQRTAPVVHWQKHAQELYRKHHNQVRSASRIVRYCSFAYIDNSMCCNSSDAYARASLVWF